MQSKAERRIVDNAQSPLHRLGRAGRPIAHCPTQFASAALAMQLAVCGPTLSHCRPAARLPASGSAMRCRTRRRLIARASSDGEQGPPPPPLPPPPSQQPGSEQQPLEGQADKSLQLPPDVIQQLRTTVFRWGEGLRVAGCARCVRPAWFLVLSGPDLALLALPLPAASTHSL